MGAGAWIWLVNDTPAANTWYVRPSAAPGTYGAEDGTSYADAWNGRANVVQGVGGVTSGDTLYVCGTHSETDRWTFSSDGFTVRGDYSTDPGHIDGSGNTTNPAMAILLSGDDLTLQNIQVTPRLAANGAAVYIIGTNATVTGCNLTGVGDGANDVGYGVNLNGAACPFTVTGNTITDFSTAVNMLNLTSTTDGMLISDNVIDCYPNSTQNRSAINIETSGGPYDFGGLGVVEGNTVSGWTSGGISVAGADNAIVRRNTINANRLQYSDPAGIFLGHNAGAGGDANHCYRNIVHDVLSATDNGSGINTRGGRNLLVYSNLLVGCNNGIQNTFANSDDNQYVANTIVCDEANPRHGIRVETDCTGITLKNTIIAGATNPITEVGTGVITYSHCDIYGGTILGTPVDGGGNIAADPALDGQYRPTNAALVGAGVAVAGVTTDYDGNTFSDPPTIGAFEMAGRLGKTGGKSRWRQRPTRRRWRVVIGGERYWVSSVAEERAILYAYLERQRLALKIAEEAEPAQVAVMRKRVKLATRRLVSVEVELERQERVRRQKRKRDEEELILMLVA